MPTLISSECLRCGGVTEHSLHRHETGGGPLTQHCELCGETRLTIASAILLSRRDQEITKIAGALRWTGDVHASTGTILFREADRGDDGSTRSAQLQFMLDGQQGFVLSGVAPRTEVLYTLRLRLGTSHDHFYSNDAELDAELTSDGGGYREETVSLEASHQK